MRAIFHIHTKHSFDSILPPKKIIKYAVSNNIDVVAITDHNSIAGSLEAQQHCQNNVKVIIGAEYQTDKGDIIGLFLKNDITSKGCTKIIQEIKKQGGIVVLPHPFKGHQLDKELIESVDLIEINNSRTSPTVNEKAFKLAREYNKQTIVGSDAHTYTELSLASIEFDTCSFCSNDLKEIFLYAPRKFYYDKGSAFYQYYSQYIKAIKTRNLSLFVSLSINLIKMGGAYVYRILCK